MSDKPEITVREDGPLLVRNLERLIDSKGETLPSKATVALCRCGASANKPFCDGTHARIGFSGVNEADRSADRRDEYQGREITVHDNRFLCAHLGACTDNLAAVFRLKSEPWIDTDGASRKAVIDAIDKCPSGALSHSLLGVEHRDRDRDPQIAVSRNGPYLVTGGIVLNGEHHRGEGASAEHFALCRCGASRNKPFCDGSHWKAKFRDKEN